VSATTRDRCDELRAKLLESAVVRRIAEGIDGVVIQRDGDHREPELAASNVDRDCLGARRAVCSSRLIRHRHERRDRRPARDRLLGRAAAHLHRAEARDRGGGPVPEPHHPVVVDDEDTVAELSEDALGLVSL
jgi:hypothetical protein